MIMMRVLKFTISCHNIGKQASLERVRETMNKQQGMEEIQRTKIIAIVRGVQPAHMVAVAHALYQGGITVMEVTLNSPDALEMISKLQSELSTHMYIGAGTVLDLKDAKKAVKAGAQFLVTPNTDEKVIEWASSQEIPIYPGAMTPTEIVKAWKAGATAVKIFPSASLGYTYLKELMGPLNHIPMIAVGGVHESNIKSFIELGCYAVGIGGSLIHLEQINQQNYAWITEKSQALIHACQ
jgi:2-dehydro-3-deoxyphosphogluconate aldolase/(4S)-4-hydroxy-2-oxoglutarate aldolase